MLYLRVQVFDDFTMYKNCRIEFLLFHFNFNLPLFQKQLDWNIFNAFCKDALYTSIQTLCRQWTHLDYIWEFFKSCELKKMGVLVLGWTTVLVVRKFHPSLERWRYLKFMSARALDTKVTYFQNRYLLKNGRMKSAKVKFIP